MGRSRGLTKIAKDIDADGNLLASAISPDVTLGGATVYANRSNLPVSGNTAGDQAYVTANNRLYIWNGSGWYNVALLNVAPAISSIQDSDGNTTPFTLSTEGAVTTITITAVDSDGDAVTYSATADSDFAGLATLSDSDNVFTITPLSQDSASTTSGTITFKATDGVNIASSGVQTFTLAFLSPLWDETVLSIGTSSTNSLNNKTFVDRSTNAITVTPTGSPVQTAFHPYLDNWSVEFDGSGDYLTVGSASDWTFLSNGDEWTIQFWCYLNSLDSQYGLIATEIGSGNVGMSIFANMNSAASTVSGTLTIRVSQGSSGNYEINDDIANFFVAGEWMYISVAFDGTDTYSFYKDGVLIDTVTGAGTYSSSTPTNTLHIGTAVNDGTTSRNFNGYLSNVRISDVVLSELNTVIDAALTNTANTSLLTCQSNRFIDNSSNDHTITVSGDPVVSAFNPFGQGSEYAAGENKGSTYFNGVDQHLNLPDDDNFELTADFTLEFWMYYESGSSTYTAIIGGNGSPDDGWNLYITTASNVISFLDHSGDFRIISSSNAIVKNQWHHVALTRSGSDTKLFVDGSQVGSTYSSTATYSQNTSNLGSRVAWDHAGGNGRFAGYISDIKLINGSASYTATFTPPTAPVGNTSANLYLPFDNPGIYDKTGNHDLTLAGNASTSTTQTKFADTAMYFDGTGDFIKFDEPNFGSSDFTIETWIYRNGNQAIGDRLFQTRDGDVYSGISWTFSSASQLRAYLDNNGSVPWVSETSLNITVPDLQWSHIALTRSGDTFRTFLNGVLQESVTVAIGNLYYAGGTAVIGGQTTGRNITGYLENFQIIKGVAKYTSNFTVPDSEQGRTYQAED